MTAQLVSHALSSVKATALGASDAMACGHITGKTITTYGSGTWSMDIQASTDEAVTWITTNAALASGVMFTLDAAVTHVRANTITYTDGTPGLRLTGWV